MRGIVVKKGIIGANDGKRYIYEGYENLGVGDEVDFEPFGQEAREIFVIKKAGNSENSKNLENSENSAANSTLASAKLFGIIGSVIGMFSAIFYVGWFFAFCAFLLMLLALHNVAKISASNALFINYLKGIVANFVGIGFIWLGIILGAILFFAGGGGSSIFGVLVALFGVFLLVYAFTKWIKTYFELSYLSDNNMFKYFAIIYIIGVCSTWLFGLGYIIMGIAFALQAFGWWQISQIKNTRAQI